MNASEYGIFRKMASENHCVSLSKALNSAAATKYTLESLKRITRPEMRYGHMGQLVMKDGVCYATFIQNPGTDGEQHYSTTSEVVLAIFTLERWKETDFSPEKDVEILRIGGLGDECAGEKAVSIFKDNSMCLVGDDIYICFSFITDDGKSHIFRKTFHIPTHSWGEEAAVRLSYKGELYDFTDETLNRIYLDKGLEPRAGGLIELVSAWSEYKGEYYATGVAIERPNNGFIVKTADFKTMTLVDTLAFNDMGTAEIGSIIYHGRLYVACRQDYSIPYLYLNYYDLEKGTWGEAYRVEDGNVRPWFFILKDELYLVNTVEELYRRYSNVSHVRVTNRNIAFFDDKMPIETLATIKDCGSYFAFYNEGDEIYYIATKNTISFGKLYTDFRTPEEVNEKLLALFGE